MIAFILRRRGFIYDHSKRMWYRHRSVCHNAPVTQKIINPKAKAESWMYRYFCDSCGKQCKSKWDFVHKRG